MKNIAKQDYSKFIVTLNMNGLQGRMIKIPAKKQPNNEVLFIYGNHSAIEDWTVVLEALTKFGKVTMPDLPGFGGMQSLYKIGEKPTINNLADYLASFIKLRYKQKKLTIFAADLGFVITTRMLQRYPEIARKVKLLVGLNGFTRHDDLNITRSRKFCFRLVGRSISSPFISWIFKALFVNHTFVNQLHRNKKRKLLLNQLSANTFKRNFDEDLTMWKVNDLKTHAFTVSSLYKFDNCQTRIKVLTWNIVLNPKYFKRHNMKQHLNVAFSDITIIEPKSKPKVDSLDKKTIDLILSPKLKRLLSRPN
jgi:pimeloyl-ACP methyl ester carboxylesterase